MDKQKPWQLYLIIAVIVLTIYNILPTIFYYTKPLKDPITASRSEVVREEITARVHALEEDSVSWLESFNKLLHVQAEKIEIDQNDPRLIRLNFKTPQDAALFSRFLPEAGALIPFVPSQLKLLPRTDEDNSTSVVVSRGVGTRITDADKAKLFVFTTRNEESGEIAPFYRQLVDDRASHLALALASPSAQSEQLKSLVKGADAAETDELVLSLAKEINEIERTFGKDSAIAKRLYSTFAQSSVTESKAAILKFINRAEALKKTVSLDNDKKALESALATVQKNQASFEVARPQLKLEEIQAQLQQAQTISNNTQQSIDLKGTNPFVQTVSIHWGLDKLELLFYPDIAAIRDAEGKNETADRLNQFVINDIAQASRIADETIAPEQSSFVVELNTLQNAQSFLALDLGALAEKQASQVLGEISHRWTPKHPDLTRENYPIRSYDAYLKETPDSQKLGLVIYAPAAEKGETIPGFRNGSVYIIARGLDTIIQRAKTAENTPENQVLSRDFQTLNQFLQQNGFIGYTGSSYGAPAAFAKDYIFELNDYYSPLLKATREDFQVKGSNRYAVLDFSNVEQRILTRNKINDRIQEDLVKWREEYASAQVDQSAIKHYTIPEPTKNAFWENFKLSFKKYFAGDDRKILKWGLDLSGGKTVRIGLRDQNNRPVTNPTDVTQAVNELYKRVNNMGVSERTIRVENNNIVLDFPGSQELSAAELLKASSMTFHVVNEKFGVQNPELSNAVNQFLQGVWNEAVVTNRKDAESINEIAWEHLGGQVVNGQSARPRTETAQQLYDKGLRLPDPNNRNVSAGFDDTLSLIGVLRGDDFREWNDATHPLVIVFHNYALEGSSLDGIHSGVDSKDGNILTFGVKRSYEGGRGGSPRDDLYAWTSQFAEDRIAGTPKEAYSKGNGWRMAVILNGTIISSPSLRGALRDGGSISGRFSQREVNELVTDLNAGSLSFTPKILSEQNVSPELGIEERSNGIIASLVALALVVVAMVGYYKFAGLVASCAVLLNIFIMWGVLQNMDAALTLPGIAGIVLTIGMAVDANVLVFERIREEFKISGRIASAIQTGYRKAFSAIVDSNITTIIAAIILIQFDSGPIKGFAVTLIIGIASSMFTALFLTRYFFAGWVQNPNNKVLEMAQFFEQTNFNFLAQARKAILISLGVILFGLGLFATQYKSMFGMDFTGGYSLVVNLEDTGANKQNFRLEASEALMAAGATVNDFQIRELSKPNQLRIQLSTGMEEKGHPFYGLSDASGEEKFLLPYQANPKISWLVNALDSKGLKIQESDLPNLDKSWTVISGQFSDTMRNNAVLGLGLALLSILIYITFRFEFKYAIAAVIGLAHDILITLGLLAFLHWIGLPVQIDLQVVGALMTIIGYSLNDTIIIFDRVREDARVLRKLSFSEVVNHALNVTLSRTVMTSGTTVLVLLALVILGGKSIFDFALVMTIGVFVGTLSSLFIVAPVLLYFHNREVEQEDGLNPRRT